MRKTKNVIKRDDKDWTRLIIGLILNLLVFPGLGSYVARTKNAKKILIVSIGSLALGIVGLILCLVFIGIVLLPFAILGGIIAYVWGAIDIAQAMI